MKNRAETKESILNKSRVLIERRERRKKAFLQAGASIAACLTIGFIALAVKPWNFDSVDKNSAAVPESLSDDVEIYDNFSSDEDSFGARDGSLKYSVSVTEYLDEAIMNQDESCLIPDSMRITALPEMTEFDLSAEKDDELKKIEELCDLLLGLDLTETGRNEKIEGYLISARYGDDEVTVQIFGEIMQINGGKCMKIPSKQAQELNTFLDGLKEEFQ